MIVRAHMGDEHDFEKNYGISDKGVGRLLRRICLKISMEVANFSNYIIGNTLSKPIFENSERKIFGIILFNFKKTAWDKLRTTKGIYKGRIEYLINKNCEGRRRPTAMGKTLLLKKFYRFKSREKLNCNPQ